MNGNGGATVPPARRLELDAGAELSVRRLRLLAASIVGTSAGYLVLTGSGFPRALGALSFMAVAFWLLASRRASQRLANRERYYLTLDGEGIELAVGAQSTHVRWHEIERGLVDEDKLVVRLERRERPALELEAQWSGLGLYGLLEEIERYRSPAMALQSPHNEPARGTPVVDC